MVLRRVHNAKNVGLGAGWYHTGIMTVMAMTLRLDEQETQALRERAEREGRSMQEVARTAIREYLADRHTRLSAAIDKVRTEDAELLDRLSR